MPDTRMAKLFRNGASQAVRLPSDFRFQGTEVYATRDERTGDVILSSRPGTQAWRDFFSSAQNTDFPPEFMAERPLNQPRVDRPLFDDEA